MTDFISMWEIEAVAVGGRDHVSLISSSPTRSIGLARLGAQLLSAKWINKLHTSDQLFQPIDWAQDIAKIWKSFYEKMILKFEE